MNIAIIGNSYFGTILANKLRLFDKKNSYTYYNTSESFIDKVKFILKLPTINVVYNISATISGGGALNLALKLNKKIVQHFIGSDVLVAKKDLEYSYEDKRLINKSKYLSVVSWLKEELKDIGIASEVKYIMVYESEQEPKEFNKFSVLTYMSSSKEQFYGLDDYIKLAIDFPELEFKIAGIKNYKGLPSNIECLGWTNMLNELQKSTIFIRNAKHDGLPYTVLEALSLGRVVLFNKEFPYTNYFNSYNTLRDSLASYYLEYCKNNLKVNYNAIEYIKQTFNKDRVLSQLVEVLTK